MKYFPTLFLSFFASEFCAFIPNKLEDKSNLRKSEAKYYIVDGDVGKKLIKTGDQNLLTQFIQVT